MQIVCHKAIMLVDGMLPDSDANRSVSNCR